MEHSQRVKDSAQGVESSFASRMCFTTLPETKLGMFAVLFVEVMWQLSLYSCTGWRGLIDEMAPNSFTPSFPQDSPFIVPFVFKAAINVHFHVHSHTYKYKA